jgi:hypothetical protein
MFRHNHIPAQRRQPRFLYRSCHYCHLRFRMGEVAAFFSHEARCSAVWEESAIGCCR